MPRLARAQQLALSQIRDHAAAGLPPVRLAHRMMSALRSAIPCDGYRLFGIDPRTLLINRVLASSENDVDPRHEWLREVYLQAGRLSYIELPEVMRAGISASAMQDRQELCFGYPKEVLNRITPRDHHDLFHELRSPVGGTLFGCFPARGQWVGAVQMYRRDGAPPYRAGDVAFVKMIAPTIGEAIAASLGREQALAQTNALPHASGILLLDSSGSVSFTTPAADEWLNLLKEGGESGHTAVASPIWAARAALLSRRGANSASALVTLTSSGPARIEASPAGVDGSIAIVINSARPAEPIDLPVHWPLTEREREIATMVVRGMTSEQIAVRVFLSPTTVDWHLWNVYDKLEVDGKSGLYARFFRETMLPSFEPGGSA